ncbi:hypothetical protein Q1695_005095 [Nippostrongylus brasiliensis]|nr:hypothetical protein Q1695_005095 [Nippostrongylus brasiliensis]
MARAAFPLVTRACLWAESCLAPPLLIDRCSDVAGKSQDCSLSLGFLLPAYRGRLRVVDASKEIRTGSGDHRRGSCYKRAPRMERYPSRNSLCTRQESATTMGCSFLDHQRPSDPAFS